MSTERQPTSDIVSTHDRAFFAAYGFLVLPGLFADEIGEITAAFDEVFADPANPRIDFVIPGHRNHPRVAMGTFVERHPRLAALVADDRLVGAAEGVLGPGAHYTESDGSIYCCETEWHFDTPMQSPERGHVKFAFYLDPVEERTGALRVLPISHHHTELYRGPLADFLGFDGAIESRTGRCGEELPGWALASRPGDVLAWDFRLLHASYGSTAPRRQFAVNFQSGPVDA